MVPNFQSDTQTLLICNLCFIIHPACNKNSKRWPLPSPQQGNEPAEEAGRYSDAQAEASGQAEFGSEIRRLWSAYPAFFAEPGNINNYLSSSLKGFLGFFYLANFHVLFVVLPDLFCTKIPHNLLMGVGVFFEMAALLLLKAVLPLCNHQTRVRNPGVQCASLLCFDHLGVSIGIVVEHNFGCQNLHKPGRKHSAKKVSIIYQTIK